MAEGFQNPDKPTPAELVALYNELRARAEWHDYGHGKLHGLAADALASLMPPGQVPDLPRVQPLPEPPAEDPPPVRSAPSAPPAPSVPQLDDQPRRHPKRNNAPAHR